MTPKATWLTSLLVILTLLIGSLPCATTYAEGLQLQLNPQLLETAAAGNDDLKIALQLDFELMKAQALLELRGQALASIQADLDQVTVQLQVERRRRFLYLLLGVGLAMFATGLAACGLVATGRILSPSG